MKNLIVYFSRRGENYVNGDIIDLKEGNTERVAKVLHGLIESDMFEVRTVHEYAQDYHQCTQEAKREKEKQERPKILDYVHHFEQYENIFLCYPNWWSTMPMAMFTFLEKHQMSHKTIYPICTHEGSGLGQSIQDIHRLCPQATVKHGLAIQGSYVKDSQEDIKRWLKKEYQ